MKQIYKGKLFNYSNKALPNSYTKFKDLLFNKDNKEIKEEKENKNNENSNSYRTNQRNLIHSSLNKFNSKTIEALLNSQMKNNKKMENKSDVKSTKAYNILVSLHDDHSIDDDAFLKFEKKLEKMQDCLVNYMEYEKLLDKRFNALKEEISYYIKK